MKKTLHLLNELIIFIYLIKPINDQIENKSKNI